MEFFLLFSLPSFHYHLLIIYLFQFANLVSLQYLPYCYLYIFYEGQIIYFQALSLIIDDQFINKHVYFLIFLFQKYQRHLLEILHRQQAYFLNLVSRSCFPKPQLSLPFLFRFYFFCHSIPKELFFVFLILFDYFLHYFILFLYQFYFKWILQF